MQTRVKWSICITAWCGALGCPLADLYMIRHGRLIDCALLGLETTASLFVWRRVMPSLIMAGLGALGITIGQYIRIAVHQKAFGFPQALLLPYFFDAAITRAIITTSLCLVAYAGLSTFMPRWFAPSERTAAFPPHCEHCGYSLRGLSRGTRCPECGSNPSPSVEYYQGSNK